MIFSTPFGQLAAGIVLAILVAALAYRAGTLNRNGALAAALLGMIFFGVGGWQPSLLLLLFFLSSSFLSRLFHRKKSIMQEKFSKGSQRDAAQVLANGGIAGIFILLGLFFPQAVWAWVGCAAALAAANADTWATELGVLSPHPPRSITSFKIVERGTSGGVSLTGTLAALAGASLIALPAAALWEQPNPPSFFLRFSLFTAAGLAGSLVDSLLGATLQAIYTCPVCQKETERHPVHLCGSTTTHKRGLPWLNNDWVNTACTLSGALLAVGMLVINHAMVSKPVSSEITPFTEIRFLSQSVGYAETIPATYTRDGDDLTPDSELPKGLARLEIMSRGMGTQGINDYDNTGYDGPCPPAGDVHRYILSPHALDLEPDLIRRTPCNN